LRGTQREREERGTYLVQVDDVEFFTSNTMEETTLLVQEYNLHRLQLLGQLSRSNIGVDVEDLALVALSQAGQDGESAGTDGGFNGTLVDLRDLSNQTVLVLIEVVGGEDARGDGSGTGAELLEGSDELEVLFHEDSASDLEGFGVWQTSQERPLEHWKGKQAHL
jgi:hypothetical protein